jgi:hypothetical protein
MVGRKPLIGLLLAVGLTYGIYPYVTLYRLGQAIRSGDAVRLEAMVDWSSVREGIKEDICDLVIEQPPQEQADGKLPPFGAGFVRGIATNVVDRQVTPEALVAATQGPDASEATRGALDIKSLNLNSDNTNNPNDPFFRYNNSLDLSGGQWAYSISGSV